VVVRAVLAAAGLVYASEVDHICSHFAGYMNPFFITSVLKNPPHFPLTPYLPLFSRYGTNDCNHNRGVLHAAIAQLEPAPGSAPFPLG
jgi:hypothetical protein